MFNSKKVAKSQMESNGSYVQLHDRFSLVPKETSTPVNSHRYGTQTATQLLPAASASPGTPRRYSLSALSTPSTSRSTPRYQQCQGPLLTSLNYKDNVSMYEETKSCGLAKRIVLYNEEAEEERRVTHQQRYNGLGLFPVVHLFKQPQPTLSPSLQRVKVKLSSPEYLRLCPPEEKRKLLKEMTKPKPAFKRQNSLPSNTSTTDIGTKSVLDALKEISRKRIHSEEEHDFPEEWGKRIKTHIPNGAATPTTSKRARTDSPLQDSPTSPTLRQIKKKMCVYDEFTASKSSSDLSTLMHFAPSRIKRKTTSTSTESLIDPKHVKLVNVETQTIVPVSENKPEPPAPVPVHEDHKSKHVNSPIKVFDDARLDRIRKSRLAALMGNLAGKDAALPFKQLDNNPTSQIAEDNAKNTENTTPIAPKTPLVSSLSSATPTSGAFPVKQDKHVHFNLPAPIVSQAAPVSLPTPTVDAAETPKFSVNFGDCKAQPDLAFATPVASKAPADFPSANTPVSFIKPPLSTSNSSEKPKTPPTISNASSPKPGGFKFDLKAPAATPPSTSQNSLGLPSAESFIFNKPEQTAMSFGNEAPSAAGFGLATATKSLGTAPAFSFGTTTANDLKFGSFASKGPATTSKSDGQSFAAQNSAEPVPSIGFGGHVPASAAPLYEQKQSSGFGAAIVSSTANSPKFAFGGNQASNSFASATSVASFGATTSANTISFGTPTTTSSVAFGASSVPSSAPFGAPTLGNTISFGTPTTPSSVTFGASGAPSPAPFGTTTTNALNFGTPTTTSSVTFGANSAPSPAPFRTTTTNALNFGTPTTTSSVTFGANSVPSSAPFGAATSGSTLNFGTPTTTSSLTFGASSTTVVSSAFGVANTSATNSFGAPSTTPAASFGASSFSMPTFGASQSAFGAPKVTPTSSASPFSPALNSSNLMGKTEAPMFGSGANSAFGAPGQSSSVFGAATTKSSNPPPPYGASIFSAQTASSTPVFSFGANKTEAAFGGAATTTAGVFGAPSTSGFGSGASTFGATAPAPNTFGAAAAPSFGKTENKPAFNFGGADAKPSSIFGSGSVNSFGKPANAVSSGFTSSASNVFGQSPATFGSSSVPAPTFGGAAPTPNFSVVGAAPQQSGVFNIGTGSSVKQRTQLRAKRRT